MALHRSAARSVRLFDSGGRFWAWWLTTGITVIRVVPVVRLCGGSQLKSALVIVWVIMIGNYDRL